MRDILRFIQRIKSKLGFGLSPESIDELQGFRRAWADPTTRIKIMAAFLERENERLGLK